MKQLNNEIVKVFKYFFFFAYHPTLEEIHTFLQAKISKTELKMELDRLYPSYAGLSRLAGSKQLRGSYTRANLFASGIKYTPPQYSIERKISKRKLKNWRFKVYVKLLSFFPQIKLVGLSGSIAMMNARTDDDIDLFIITAKNRLFTGRFIALILAQILGLRRKRDYTTLMRPHSSCIYKNKVCLNLFFDESNLKVPKFKQTEFVGHEVIQMKPVVNKDSIHKRFLAENNWVFKLFPNAFSVIPVKTGIQTKITIFKMKLIDWIPSYEGMTRLFGTWNLGFKVSNNVEKALKSFQLTFINRHKTTEIITSTQLWFHPDDFGKKMQGFSRIVSRFTRKKK